MYCIAQLFGLLFGTYNDAWDTPATPVRKEMICSANLDLDHLGGLLPSMVLPFSCRIFAVALQQVPGSHTLVEVMPLA